MGGGEGFDALLVIPVKLQDEKIILDLMFPLCILLHTKSMDGTCFTNL